ncbi:MAG TPA: alkane 1-monooxygenase [Bacteroidia bacterium]|nr:alkane 1-monooxygenase [Bacteroidia bacterium]
MPARRNYKYILSLIPGLLVVTGNLLGGAWVAANTIFSLGVLGLVEWVAPEDKNNDSKRNDWFPDLLLYCHVGLQLIALGSLIYFASLSGSKPWLILLASLSTGINTGGSGIVVAHELIHRKEGRFRFLGKLLLFTAGNFYFCIDHLKGHHRWVGTINDPATSRQGESLYRFAIRSATGQAKSSWKLETERLIKKGSRYPSGFGNYVTAAISLELVALLAVQLLYGWIVLLALIIQGVVACFLLEYTNYIEHYGLKRTGDERVSAVHSWQTDKVISRFFLIDLSRHADHHYQASKPYHTLMTHKESPVLPGGYVSMIFLALVPPLFFKIVNPVLDKHLAAG